MRSSVTSPGGISADVMVADILFRHISASTIIRFMDNASLSSTTSPGGKYASWTVQ